MESQAVVRLALVLAACSSSQVSKAPPANHVSVDAGELTDDVVTKPKKLAVVMPGAMVTSTDPDAPQLAERFVAEIVAEVKATDRFELRTSPVALAQALALLSCKPTDSGCLISVAKAQNAERMLAVELYGPPWQATIWFVAADGSVDIAWNGAVFAEEPRHTAHQAIPSLLSSP